MAWIAKNSATVEVSQDGDPLITDDMRTRFTDEILIKYDEKQGALLPVLHEVQHHIGYLPLRALIEIAEFLEIAPSQVLDTASFYDEFMLKPVGKVQIGICQSIACEAMEHTKLVDHACKRLSIKPNETTDDGKVTLRVMECLGSCDTAPCALVNETRFDNLTIETLDAVIDDALS